MEQTHDNKQQRQPYEKPRLRVIPLVAEEVLATGCKNIGFPSRIGGPACQIDACSAISGS